VGAPTHSLNHASEKLEPVRSFPQNPENRLPKMTPPPQIDPNDWQISAPQPGTKGGKTCLISQNTKPIEINLGLGEPLGCPWGASSFEDDATQTRVNLDMTLDDENANMFRGVDSCLIAYAIQNKETLFKNKTDAQISESYRNLVREKEGYRPMLRTKVNLERARCWDEHHQPTKVPESKFKNAELWPKLTVRTLWFVNQTWGLTLEVTDIKFREVLLECPF
jgi:hypothetical protein